MQTFNDEARLLRADIEKALSEHPLYPSSTLHRVEPVRRGQRRVAIGWIQSTIRDPAQREVLFDLDTARRQIFERDGKTTEFDLLTKSLANLQRFWAEI